LHIILIFQKLKNQVRNELVGILARQCRQLAYGLFGVCIEL